MARRILLVAGVLACLPLPHASAQARQQSSSATPAARASRFTPAQLHEAGARIVQDAIARHGRNTNPVWNRQVATILDRLERAADLRDRLEFIIVDDSTMNAGAVPGGYFIVNAGLLTTFADFARTRFPSDTAAARAEYEGFLASALGHELAHQTLGHTADVGQLAAARAATGGAAEPPDASLRAIEKAMADPEMLRDQRRSRGQETDADRMGSIYALRAGWTIQHGIDLFRLLDSVERAEGETRALEALTWLRDHPRSSERVANLEHLRGTLTADQTRYDDAVTLVRSGVQLDTAIVLLDTVLAHFPHLHPAQHLRAAAMHKQFIRRMSARDLAVRSAVPTYDADIIGGVRGALPAATMQALDRARRAYRAVLVEEMVPYSMSNLAVLDAYAGNAASARARADSAVGLDTADAALRLNRGVVHFVAGRAREALADFQAAERLYGDANPIITFDIGRALLATGDSAAGSAKLMEYADADDEGAWHDLAVSLANRAAGSASASATTKGKAPVLSLPVGLGTAASAVRQTLGDPDEAGLYQGSIVWRYTERGVVVVLGKGGVIMIGVDKPGAGAVDGIRVGDPTSKAISAWGAPTEREGTAMYFERGALVVAIDSADGRIETITIARTR